MSRASQAHGQGAPVQRVLWFTRYDSRGASSRYRAYQYLPFLAQQGITSVLHSMGPPRQYGFRAWELGPPMALRIVRSAFPPSIAPGSRTVVQKELLPPVPLPASRTVVERFFETSGAIWDVDDALYASTNGVKRGIAKWSAKSARIVVAGNRVLADWCLSQGAPNVRIIPTCANVLGDDQMRERLRTDQVDRHPTLVWLGSPATQDQLGRVARQLIALKHRFPRLRFLIVGGRCPAYLRGESWVEEVKWSPRSEAHSMMVADVGIAPLRRGPLEDGKCGHKVVQYMAHGVVPCATANPVHEDVVGGTGVLIGSSEDWYDALSALLADPERCRQLAWSAWSRARACYSVEVGATRWYEILAEAV